MNSALSFGRTLTTNHSVGPGSQTTDRLCPVEPRRLFCLTVALVWLVGLCPLRAFAYGVYEERISGSRYVRDDSPLPLPNLDAPEFFSDAFFTPPPQDRDPGLLAIEGSLNPDSGDFADMYCIRVGGRFLPTAFAATGLAPFRAKPGESMLADPQLFLFDRMGHPVVGNDDTDDLNLQPTFPAGTITEAGIYILAITAKGYVPTDEALGELFTNIPQGLKMPTDRFAVQAGWSGTHNQSGRYRIDFHDPVSGRETLDHCVPEPSTLALLVLGLGSLASMRCVIRLVRSVSASPLCFRVPRTASTNYRTPWS